MIDSWGGALLFVAFLAEMRHPMDFWKGLMCAQFFICIVYIFFGVFVSHFLFRHNLELANHKSAYEGLQLLWTVLGPSDYYRH